VISLEGGKGRGSARSIENFHLYEGLKRCEDLLEGFGGHRYAAGLTINEKNIPEFQNVFEEVVGKELSEEDFIPHIHIDGQICLRDITSELLNELEMLSPFGPYNPEPTFCSSILYILGSCVVGTGHLKLKVKEDGVVCDAIGFNMGTTLPSHNQHLKAAFVPQINEWQGVRTVQLRLKDIRFVDLGTGAK